MIVSVLLIQATVKRGDGGMVDAGDLKSPDRKVVRVRLPLAPPSYKAASQATFPTASHSNKGQETLFFCHFL